MQVCVAGWYYRERFLRVVSGFGGAVVVGHREPPAEVVPLVAARMEVVDNRGLEFGCYQRFLEHWWDGASDVLFIHDDTELDKVGVLAQIEKLAETGFEQIYLFSNEYEEFLNVGRHGRAMWCRGSWLSELRDAGGFPADWSNRGDTEGPALNNGIRDFHRLLAERWPKTTGFCAIVPGLRLGRRGWMSDRLYCYKRDGNGSIMTPEA